MATRAFDSGEPRRGQAQFIQQENSRTGRTAARQPGTLQGIGIPSSNMQIWEGEPVNRGGKDFAPIEGRPVTGEFISVGQQEGTGQLVQIGDLWEPINRGGRDFAPIEGRPIAIEFEPVGRHEGTGQLVQIGDLSGHHLDVMPELAVSLINSEIGKIDSRLDILNASLTNKRTELEKKKAELEAKEAELNEAKAKLLEEEGKLNETQSKIDAKNKEKQETLNLLEERQNDLIIKLGQARNEALKKAQQEYDPDKDGDYNAYLSEKLSQVGDDPGISSEIAELNNKLTGINNELNTLNNELMNRQNAVRSATQNVNCLQNEVCVLTNTVSMLEIEANTLENEIRTIEATKTTTENAANEQTAAQDNSNRLTGGLIDAERFAELINNRDSLHHRGTLNAPSFENLENLAADMAAGRLTMHHETVRARNADIGRFEGIPFNTVNHERQTGRTISPDVPRGEKR